MILCLTIEGRRSLAPGKAFIESVDCASAAGDPGKLGLEVVLNMFPRFFGSFVVAASPFAAPSFARPIKKLPKPPSGERFGAPGEPRLAERLGSMGLVQKPIRLGICFEACSSPSSASEGIASDRLLLLNKPIFGRKLDLRREAVGGGFSKLFLLFPTAPIKNMPNPVSRLDLRRDPSFSAANG